MELDNPGLGNAGLDDPGHDAGLDNPGGEAFAPGQLGSPEFLRDYGVRYAYAAGSMFRGISSVDLVARMSQAGLLAYFGTGGLPLETVEEALTSLRQRVAASHTFGMNLLCNPDRPEREEAVVSLLLRHDVRHIEAAAVTRVTPSLVRFRFSGAHRDAAGGAVALRHVMAKVSRLDIARTLLAPPPTELVNALVAQGHLTREEAEAAGELPVVSDLCAEADSGGHTDRRNPQVLLPELRRLREDAMTRHGYAKRIRVGSAGGLGTPEAVAAAFVSGADFVVTGSVNQCTPEAGTSDAVKDLLAELDSEGTAFASSPELFELGAQVQVVRRNTSFAPRANRLYQLYRTYDSLEAIEPRSARVVQEGWFGKSFEEVWEETRAHIAESRPHELERAEKNPRHRMALIFGWWFARTTRAAVEGDVAGSPDFQVHCGPAMGAFNRYVAGGPLENWRHRHVDSVAEVLMGGAADVLSDLLARLRTPHAATVRNSRRGGRANTCSPEVLPLAVTGDQ
ncbi:PfaD family polyunsaturated fatty acid/polyketide biosynthesis protein [Streptomyces diastaticus]|uniref:PfaD family polyunsaturated fatty acid/polyketide biosynthesis protein n=1 Tax=Streptomyces diastaticus TaxID=1956 RepID=UPI0036540D6C